MANSFTLTLEPNESRLGVRIGFPENSPYLVVLKVRNGSAADRAGLVVDDIVLYIDSECVVRKSFEFVRSLMDEGTRKKEMTVVLLRNTLFGKINPKNGTKLNILPIRMQPEETKIINACFYDLRKFIEKQLSQYRTLLDEHKAIGKTLSLSKQRKSSRSSEITKQRELSKAKKAVASQMEKIIPSKEKIVDSFRKIKLLYILLTRMGTYNEIDMKTIAHYFSETSDLFIKLNRAANYIFGNQYDLVNKAGMPLFNRETLAEFRAALTESSERVLLSKQLNFYWTIAVEDWESPPLPAMWHYQPLLSKFDFPISNLRCIDPNTLLDWRRIIAERHPAKEIQPENSKEEEQEKCSDKRFSNTEIDIDAVINVDNHLTSLSTLDDDNMTRDVTQRRFRDYRNIKMLGKGTFGRAILCSRLCDNEQVVIKEVSLDNDMADFNRREVEIMHEVNHPFIVSMYTSFEEKGVLYIEMEYCSKGNLLEVLRYYQTERLEFPKSNFSRWTTQLAQAVQYLHSKNIIHRDIKPANIFLSGEVNIKLGDLGAAKENCPDGQTVNALNEYQHTHIGTALYMSPESLTSMPYGLKADVWSLGVVFYEMATLRQPFILGKDILTCEWIPVAGPYSNNKKLSTLFSKIFIIDTESRITIDEVLILLPEILT